MKKNKKTRYFIWFLVILLLCFIYSAVRIRYYAKNYYETKSDAAIVLGAGTYNGTLSKVYEERVLHAIDLFRKKSVRMLIFTGGYGKGQTISDSKAAKIYALKMGVPPDNILIEQESTITFYNIKNAKEIMRKNNLSTALLVSDPYHMKRSMDMCERIGINALPSPTPTSMYKSRQTKSNFLLKETFNYWGYLLAGRYRKLD